MTPLRVLVACEFSGIVRQAFTALGHEATSCDLLPTEIPGSHYQGDVRDILGMGWDLMIAHPPCEYLAFSGIRHWNKPGRAELREEAAAFFMECANAPIEHICIENSRGIMSQWWRKPDQAIHPYYFGDSAMKRTCLWLKNLPELLWFPHDSMFPTAVEQPEPIGYYSDTSKQPGKAKYFTDTTKSPHERARTFPSIARAMASQWGAYLTEGITA